MKKIVIMVLAMAAVSASAAGKNWNVYTSPLSDLVGIWNVGVGYDLGGGWTAGGSFATMNWTIAGSTVSGTTFGVRGDYHFNGSGFADGWYLGGNLSMVNVTVKETYLSTSYEGSASATTYGIMGGYMWMWDAFNIMLGGGFSSAGSSSVTMKDSGGNSRTYSGGFAPNSLLEFNLGWAF